MSASFIPAALNRNKRSLFFFWITLIALSVQGQTTLYSYQSGSWDNIDVWTTDPGGTTLVGSKIPGTNDFVVILSSRTVSLNGNISTTGLSITINAGAVLDAQSFAFSNTLTSLQGQGTYRLKSAGFPSATSNGLVLNGGGTVEYYNDASFNFPQSLASYFDLKINCNGFIATQLSDITVYGDLTVQSGTYRINDGTATRRTLIVNGNLDVSPGAFLTVGNGNTTTTTDPTTAGEGGTAPFLDYYVAQSHLIEIYGNLTNNGTVRFTNQDFPVFNAFPTNGMASVFFRGTGDKALTCNGQTDFYNLVLDKGTDQTYTLSINSAGYNKFRIFGANVAGDFIGADASNPNIRKAIWIRNGTLKLNGYTFLPSLTEGGGDFIIPGNGALEINSPDAVVMSTIDNYSVVELAYGVNGGGGANGVATGSVIQTDLALYGKLEVNEGKLYVGEYSRIVYYGSSSSAQFIINGGIIDTKQFQSVVGGGRTAYWQTGGILVLRGRFQRTLVNTSLTNLISSVGNVSQLNTTRADGPDPGSSGTLNIDQPENIFRMEGGSVEIYDVTGTAAGTPDAIEINADPANISVTGGIITIDMRDGTGTNTDYGINSTAPVFNAIIKRTSGTFQSVVLKRSFEAHGDLTLSNTSSTAGVVFKAFNNKVILGEDFLIQANAGYDPGNNRTIFNGTGTQNLTNLGTISSGLYRFIIDKNSGTLSLGSQISVRDSLVINSGILNDGGYILNVAGNVYNAGTHTGTGKIIFNGDARQYIYADDESLFGNLELKSTYNTSPYWALTFTSDVSAESFRLAGTRGVVYIADFGLTIRNMALHLGDRATNYSATKMFMTDGSHSAKGINLYMSLTGNLNTDVDTIPLGVYHQATTPWFSEAIVYASGNLGTTTYTGNVTVTPVDAAHPSNSNPGNVINYYWKTFCTGTITSLNPNYITFRYYNSNITLPTGGGVKHYYLESGTSNWVMGGNYSSPNNPLIFNLGFMSGAFTAGKNNPFLAPKICKAVASGFWDLASTWDAGVPASYDYAVIGGSGSGNYTVTIRYQNTVCAGVSIYANGVADDSPKPTLAVNANLTGINFTTVSGGGKFVLNGTNTIVLPAGDFDLFCKNDTATFEYNDPGPGTYSYTMPSGIQTYPNLHISGRGNNSVRILPDKDVVVLRSLRLYSSFNSNTLRAESPNPRLLTIYGNLDLRDGSIMEFSGDGVKTINLHGNLDFQYGGTNNNNTIRAALPGSVTHIFNFFGDTIFSGASSINFNPVGNPKCDFYFKGPGNVLVTEGTGSFNLNRLFIQKDVLNDTIRFNNNFNLNESGNSTALKSLMLYTGTLIISDPGNSSASSVNLNLSSGGPNYLNLNSASRLVLRNGAKVNISGTGQGSGIRLDGSLQAEGASEINLADGTSTNTGYIEYTGSGNSEIILSGSSTLKAAQIRRSLSLTTGVLRYSQSDSSVTTVYGYGADGSRAKFEVTGTGSSFNLGGSSRLNVIRGGGATYGDLYLRPELSTITGGEIILGTGVSGQSFRIDATVPMQDLIIDAAAGATNSVQLMVNPLVLKGNLTLTPDNTSFSSNNINITIGGNLILNGTYSAGSNTTFLNGITQSISGTTDPGFNNLVLNSSDRLTLQRSITVNAGLTINSGTLEAGIFSVTVRGNVLNNGIYTNDPAASSRLYLNGTSVQNISGAGSYGRIEIDNATGGAKLGNDLSLTEDLKLSNGILNISQYSLTLGAESDIAPVAFGVSRMIKSDGVFSNGGIVKHFSAGYNGTFIFPSGITGKYTPASLDVVATGAGWVRIKVINEKHPATLSPFNVLGYYWEAESSISGFDGSLTCRYEDTDVTGDEAQYVAGRLVIPPGTGWSKAAPGPLTDNVDEATNTILFSFPSGTTNLGGHYTAGYSSDLPNTVPVYTSNTPSGDWNVPNSWTPAAPAGGPNGVVVIIRAGDVINTNGNKRFAFKTTINGTLNIGTSYGHNFGSVDGTGTLSMSQANLPAGDFSNFVSCSGGTLEYDGGSYTIVADRLDTVRNIIFKGTGTKTLPDKDLVICNLIEINGPVLDNHFNRKLTVGGSFILTTGSFASGSGADATVTFNGSAPQTVSGFNASNPLYNLEINNTTGLTLGSNTDLNGNLLLTNGVINTTGSYKLRMLSQSAVISGGSVTSFVNGVLSKNQFGGISFVFHVGKGNRYGNIALMNPQSGTWEAEYFNSNFGDPDVDATLGNASTSEYWKITSPADSKTASVRLRWDNLSDINPLTTSGGINDIRVAEYTGTLWTMKESSVPVGDNNNGTVQTSAGITINRTTHPYYYTLGSVSTVKPTIILGLPTPVCRCFSPAELPYTLTTGLPDQYTIDFDNVANAAGFADVSWTALTSSPININVPASVSAGVYNAAIRVRKASLPTSSIPYAFSVIILAEQRWSGTSGTDWATAGNWLCGFLPDTDSPVEIPDVPNKPVVGVTTTASVNNLTINSGSSVTVNGTLQISGIITNNGSFNTTNGKVVLNGSAAQSIGTGMFTGNTIMDLTVNNPAGVSLTGLLNLTGILKLQSGNLISSGNLTLVSNASGTALIDGSGTGNVLGNVTMQRYLSSRFGYKYFSSPFQNATVSEFGGPGEVDLTYWFPLFYAYNENREYSGTDIEPFYGYATGTNVLNPMEGYAANFGSSTTALTVDATGVVNNGFLSKVLSNSNHLYSLGRNLVGNPYPSPIDWNADPGWIKTNIDNALYYFKSSATDEWEGSYSSYVNGVSSDGVATNIIPSMQGFMVHVTDGPPWPVTGTLSMDNRVRVVNFSQPFIRKSVSSGDKPLLRLSAALSAYFPHDDPMVIYFDEKATDGFDKELDAIKYFNTDHTLASFFSFGIDGSRLSINALPVPEDSIPSIRLGYRADEDGEVIFKLKDLQGFYSWGAINLFDSVTHQTTDLSGGSEYRVFLPAGEYFNRFFLNFEGLAMGQEIDELEEDQFKVYSYRGIICAEISLIADREGTLSIINITGQKVYDQKIHENGRYEIDRGLKDGLYIVSFVSGDLRISRKVVISRQ